MITAERKLEKMRPARGYLAIRRRGIMGVVARDSTMRNIGEATQKIAKEAMMNGWFLLGG